MFSAYGKLARRAVVNCNVRSVWEIRLLPAALKDRRSAPYRSPWKSRNTAAAPAFTQSGRQRFDEIEITRPDTLPPAWRACSGGCKALEPLRTGLIARSKLFAPTWHKFVIAGFQHFASGSPPKA
jgi:hypothetical protein